MRFDCLSPGRRAGVGRANLGGEIKTDLQRREEVIGPNDLHIAAHARSEALTLVTNNQREFAPVDGLRTARWVMAAYMDRWIRVQVASGDEAEQRYVPSVDEFLTHQGMPPACAAAAAAATAAH